MQADLICIDCKYFNQKNLNCKAFPDGIPDVIISGASEHSTPLPNQNNDIIYEPVEEKNNNHNV